MDKRTVRREIVKGSLAAPLVLTVSSASAVSLSSFGRCLRRPGNGEAAPAFFLNAGQPDGWFRKSVNVVHLAYKDKPRGVFYLDPKLSRYVSTEPPYTPLGFGAADLPAGWRQTGAGKRWALVYFDKASTSEYRYITVQRPAGFNATTVSCYSSFRA